MCIYINLLFTPNPSHFSCRNRSYRMKLVILVFVAALAAVARAGCKAGWFHAGNKCFLLQKRKMSNAEAALSCHRYGAKLARVSSLIEHEALQGTLVVNNAGSAWIVFNDKNKEGTFTNAGNIFIGQWNRGEPNNLGNVEDSVHILTTAKWNDINVNGKYPYVCQIWGERPGWVKYGAKSLKLFPALTTYSAARANCKKQLGRIVEVESSEEDALIRSLEKPARHHIRIGLDDIVNEGHFTIADRYTNWARNAPNNRGGNEDCVEMRQVGEWNDLSCCTKLVSFCSYPLKI
ncbi:secretory phospholipase A2 receptor-like [Tubulanus polymorphus]|uniref:secretory phospholipase A2 receptor-like n=1 Tax=Tubulanus polymorphus TaxID=672921 RepID=UPI003DA3B8D8